MKRQHPVEIQIEKANAAILAEDFDALLATYANDAILVVEPGRNAVGKSAICTALKGVVEQVKSGLQIKQSEIEVVQSGRTALVLAKTLISAPNLPEVKRNATYVFRRSMKGEWLCTTDNSYGHEVLDVKQLMSA